jgi:hypothetical protein
VFQHRVLLVLASRAADASSDENSLQEPAQLAKSISLDDGGDGAKIPAGGWRSERGCVEQGALLVRFCKTPAQVVSRVLPRLLTLDAPYVLRGSNLSFACLPPPAHNRCGD